MTFVRSIAYSHIVQSYITLPFEHKFPFYLEMLFSSFLIKVPIQLGGMLVHLPRIHSYFKFLFCSISPCGDGRCSPHIQFRHFLFCSLAIVGGLFNLLSSPLQLPKFHNSAHFKARSFSCVDPQPVLWNIADLGTAGLCLQARGSRQLRTGHLTDHIKKSPPYLWNIFTSV